MKKIALLLTVLQIASPASAAMETASFNARSTAMADALTADPQGLSGLTLNPAALGHLRRTQVQANIRRLHQVPGGPTDLSGSAIGAAIPFQNSLTGGVVGLSWVYDEFANVSLDRSIGFSYATRSWREIGPGVLDIGTTLRLLSRSGLAGGSITRLAVDLGTYYEWGQGRAVGLSLMNINSPDMSVNIIRDQAPAELRLGYSQRVHRFTFAADISKREASLGKKSNESLAVGAEHAWGTARYGSFTARTGVSFGNITRTWSLGAGWSLFGTQVDYAMRIPVSGGGERWGHVVSLTYKFGQWNPEAEYERLLSSEIRYRADLSRALEAAEVKQWRLAEELRAMRQEIEDVRRALEFKDAETGVVEEKLQRAQQKLKVKELEDRRRAAQGRLDRLRKERERMQRADIQGRYNAAWKSYQAVKGEGVADVVLIDRLKKILREYQDKGVDVDDAHRELQRLLKTGL
jgi:hypothetical protein